MAALSRAELDALVDEATVDAYDEDEQLTGLYSMLEEHLAVPSRWSFQHAVLVAAIVATAAG